MQHREYDCYMRSSGIVQSARDLLPFGHLGWSYQDCFEFRDRAYEYIADGLAAGQWVEYVGTGTPEELSAEVTRLGPVAAEALAAGRIGVCPVGDFYAYFDGGQIVNPVASVAKRVAATQTALAAGYAGFRAVVDATPVARTPEQRDAFGQFEHLIDRTMSRQTVSTICAYDMGQLGTEAATEMACLHPYVGRGSTPFWLYAVNQAHAALGLGGEVDSFCADPFATAVGRILALIDTGTIGIDGRDLAFINHRGLLAIDRQAADRGRQVVLYSASPVVALMADVLRLESVSAAEVTPAGTLPG